jgi:hypothetical protein
LLNRELELSLSPTNVNESIDGLSLEPGNVFGVGRRVRFSLTPGSPTLAVNGWSPADVLTVIVGFPGTLARSIPADRLGLLPSDDLDGLVIFEVHDMNGDGILTDPGDFAIVYFSVANGSWGVASSAVRNESAGNGAGGDIFTSALGGTNALVADNVNWIQLAGGDDIDALDELHRYFGDPPLVTGGALPPTPPIPNPPPYVPPLCGMGGIKIGFCDQTTGGFPACVKITIKLCDPAHNRVEASTGLQKAPPIGGGAAGANALAKANFAARVLKGMTVNKPGIGPVPVFAGVKTAAGGGGAFPSPPIQAVVCAVMNPALAACGWSIDAVCVDGSLITHGLRPLLYQNTPAGVKWRFGSFGIPAAPEQPGDLGITFSDYNPDPTLLTLLTYQTPFAAGENPAAILGRIRDQILADGGSAVVAGNWLRIAGVALEPPPSGELLGPGLVEWGANNNSMIVQTESVIRTERAVLGSSDWNGDDLINLTDWSNVVGCMSGPSGFPVPSPCYAVDVDGSLHVDLLDVALFQNRFSPFPPPFNDTCAQAPDVAQGVTLFTTVGAHTDGPPPGAQCGFDGPFFDVWYDYIATCTGLTTISVAGSNFEAALVVYDGCGCPVTNDALLACGASATIPVVAGQCYKLRIGGVGGSTGSGSLSITCAAPPSVCGPGNPQSCFLANPGPGCGDAECCMMICAVDPFCCNVSWDAICASEALDVCPTP